MKTSHDDCDRSLTDALQCFIVQMM